MWRFEELLTRDVSLAESTTSTDGAWNMLRESMNDVACATMPISIRRESKEGKTPRFGDDEILETRGSKTKSTIGIGTRGEREQQGNILLRTLTKFARSKKIDVPSAAPSCGEVVTSTTSWLFQTADRIGRGICNCFAQLATVPRRPAIQWISCGELEDSSSAWGYFDGR
jgi:hypothetical protein